MAKINKLEQIEKYDYIKALKIEEIERTAWMKEFLIDFNLNRKHNFINKVTMSSVHAVNIMILI